MKHLKFFIILCCIATIFSACETKLEKDVKNAYVAETIGPAVVFAKLVDNSASIELVSCKQINNYDSIVTEADEYQMIVDSINLIVLNLQEQWVDTYNYEKIWEPIVPINWEKLDRIKSNVNLETNNYNKALQIQDSLKKYGVDKYHIIKFEVKNKSNILGVKNINTDTILVKTSLNYDFIELL